MASVKLGSVEIEYERRGSPADPLVLLVMGLGAQLISWDEPFCDALVAEHLQVIRFDNRDSGLSTHFDEFGVPSLLEGLLGAPAAPYGLEDMAADAAGLLRELGCGPAHVVGISMGGMIAQLLAIHHPDLVLSLTSIMSGPAGAASVTPSPEVVAALLQPPSPDREGRIQQAVALRLALAGPGAELDQALARGRAARQHDRNHAPEATLRQAMAVLAAPDRTAELRRLTLPALVVHGEADPFVPYASGLATAGAIPGARLLSFPGLGHDLPPPVAMEVVRAIAAQVQTTPTAGDRLYQAAPKQPDAGGRG